MMDGGAFIWAINTGFLPLIILSLLDLRIPPGRRTPNDRTADTYASSSTRFTPPDCLDKSVSQGLIRESNGRMTNREEGGSKLALVSL